MIIGTKELLELVEKIKLVEHLSERELTNPEGEGFDLRVGEIYKIKENQAGFLGIRERSTPDIELLESYHPELEQQPRVTVNPRDYILVRTIENINLPDNISAIFTARTTLQRSGIILKTSNASPGYSGQLTFGMYNAGNAKFLLELGARITTAIFYRTSENISEYRGQWSSGRVSTRGELEKQV